MIINYYKTERGNLDIPFLSCVMFNKVFSQEKTGCNSFKSGVSQKRNINRKKSHTVFFPNLLSLSCNKF